MLLNFFDSLRGQGIPVTFKELSVLISALEHGLAFANIEEFYFLSRACMVKDEKYFDKFDRAFTIHLSELNKIELSENSLSSTKLLLDELIKKAAEQSSGEPETFGTLEGLADTDFKGLDQAYDNQFGRNRGIGTAGTSPLSSQGTLAKATGTSQTDIGEGELKPWDARYFKELDDNVQLGTRNIKMALRRLRRFARTGAEQELDMDSTIRSTAHNAGLLDIKMQPVRHNSIKVILLFDIGGSMDAYVRHCEELFSAARSEFKHLEYYYFHNFVYESLWQTNQGKYGEVVSTLDVLHKYGPDYKVIFVGDASMGTHEILRPGASVDFDNAESGAAWLKRFTDYYEKVVWLNPEPQAYWHYSSSTRLVQELMDDRMYALTPKGLDSAIRYLSR